MKFIGVDQSLRFTGVCTLDDDSPPQLTTIKTKELKGPARLIYIRDMLLAIIGVDTDLVAIEGYAYDKTMGAHQLGEIGGILRVALYENKIPFIVVAPKLVKKFATGDSDAKKEAMIVAAKLNDVNPDDDHQADAFALANVAAGFHSNQGLNTRAKLEVIHSLKNKKVKKTRKIRRVVSSAM